MSIVRRNTRFLLTALGLPGLLALVAAFSYAGFPLVFDGKLDPAKVVGPERCANCHKAEVAHWQTTHHFLTFAGNEEVEALHRREKADQILTALGQRSAKRGICTDCHYTQQAEGDRERSIAGISCESCHGAAADFVEFHGVFGDGEGGDKATREQETAEHREARLKAADAAGQIRTNNLYAIIENCFGCHTVPNEELVNVGGHKAGSDFNYLQWLNKEIRHNFLYSDGAVNRAAPRDMDPVTRNRLAYVVAELLDVEFGLRGLATATGDGAYAESLKARVAAGLEALEAVKAAAPAIETQLGAAIEAVQGAELVANNGPAILSVAEAVKAQAKGILAASDGSDLEGVDALLPEIQ